MPRLLPLAAVLLVASLSCDRAEPPPRPADDQARPDPEHALRPPSERGRVDQAAHVVDYDMHARLDGDAHRIEASATLTWKNRGPAPVQAIPMHLYLNGFRAQDTAWMREGRLAGRTAAQGGEHPWGYIDVQSISAVGDGESLTPLSYAERDEPSLMDVQLAEPVPPGDTVTLQLTWETQLPRVFARSGYAGEFHMVGQWFPKPCVLLPDGHWADDPFTYHSEFFADFGDWDVTLDVPYTMSVGATGVRTEASTEDDRRTVHYHAEMVHDFAWAAGPGLVEHSREHDGVSIRQLMVPERIGDAQAHFEIAAATLDSMQRRYSPYPWSTLTIIHPPPGAGGAGGMEYPTLFTSGDIRPLPSFAEAIGFSERFSGRYVTAHELGHQWFQGMLASNEYAQPWLDEGLNSFSNMMVYFDHFADGDDVAGEDVWVASIAGLRFSLGDGLRVQQRWRARIADISDQPASAFSPLVGDYAMATYRRTAAWMMTLRALVGRERFDAAMLAYAEAWRFGHPTGADLEQIFVDRFGRRVPLTEPDADGHRVELDVRQFLHQALRTTAEADFAVDRIEIVPRMPDEPAGYHRVDGELVGGKPPALRTRRELAEAPDSDVESVVLVRRHGAFVVPVVIELRTDDGAERVVWSGRGRAVTIRRPGQRIRAAIVDPDGDLYLEGRRRDNIVFARDFHPARTLGERLGDSTQAAALAVLGGFGP